MNELIALERVLLGAAMLHPSGWRQAAEHVTAASFYRGTHRTAWEAICACYAEYDIAEPLLVSDWLKRHGIDEPTALELTLMVSEAPAGAMAGPYARTIAEQARRRELQAAGQALASRAVDPEADPAETLAEHLATLDAKPAGRLWRLYTDAELDDIPPPEWLIRDHLTTGLTFIAGPSQSGKSFLALDMAFSVASGREWFGYPVQRGRVVYVAAEGASGVAKRREAWRLDRKAGTNGFHLIGGVVNLGDPTHVAALTADVDAVNARLLVVDTLARCVPGLDENSAKDMGQVVGALDRIRERTGCAVVVVHHTGKDRALGMRGSSALFGAADTEIRVDRGEVMEVSCSKQKDAAPFHRWHFALKASGASCVLTTAPKPQAGYTAPWEEA